MSTFLSARSLRWAAAVFLVARLALSAWALAVSAVVPLVLQNLDLFGSPVLAAFDLSSSSRYAYARQVDASVLTFRPAAPGYVADLESGSVWSLQDGKAVSGEYSGRNLAASTYSVEDIFPYRGIAPDPNPLLAIWQRFDTNWYLEIAARGYDANDGSTVYLPAFPELIRLAGVVVGDPMLAAVVVSNLALVGALALLIELARDLADETAARRAAVYLVICPAGFFLLAAYGESLFLFFSLAAFLAAERGRWLLAGLFGALAALTRLQGVLLIIPLLYVGWRWWQAGRSEKDRAVGKRSLIVHLAPLGWLVLIPAATLAFLIATDLSLLGSYQQSLHAQFVWPWQNVAASLALLASASASPIDLLNLAATLGLVAMAVAVWRRLPREYGLYSVAMLLAPLARMTTTQPLVSMVRYALAIFPVFVLLGMWGRNAWVNRAVVYLSLPLQLYLSAQFFLWGWVG